jgi:hypothetical protein
MAKYKKVQLNYDAIQYTGDIDALLEFGVPKVDYQQYKTKHVAIPTEKGEALCAVDDYITKDQFGNFEVVP